MIKKWCACTISVFILLSFCACSASAERPAPDATPSNTENAIPAEMLDSIQSAVKLSVDSYDCDVIVSEKDGKADVSLSMSGGMIGWAFADCVYFATTSAREEIEKSEVGLGELRVTFVIKNPGGQDSAMKWTSIDFDSGELVDMGSGPDDIYIGTITLEELMERYDYTPPK